MDFPLALLPPRPPDRGLPLLDAHGTAPLMSASQETHPNISLPAAVPAPYGQACSNCSQSKCKCTVRHTGGPCERCIRLNMNCTPAETVRRRRNPRKPMRKSTVSKTARLEEKLDALVSLIKAGAQSGSITTSPRPAIDESSPQGIKIADPTTPSDDSFERGSRSSSSNAFSHNGPAFTPVTDDYSSSSLPHSTSYDAAGDPSPAEAEEYLQAFLTYKLMNFPFIHIPYHTTALELQQERPFLWLCIMAVSSKSTLQQQMLGNRIRQIASQEIVVRSERNVDLLLGLLTFIGWAHYQTHSKPFLAVFSQLAMSLVFELGLNKPVPNDTQISPCVKENSAKHTPPRTMEERRAVLGCFLISSITSSFLQKTDALRWTPHMNECLQLLDERKEYPNDDILVQQVRLQLIAEKMTLSTSYDVETQSTASSKEETPFPCLGTLHLQLQSMKAEFLTRPQTEKSVLLHLYSTGLENSLSVINLDSSQLTSQQRKSLTVGLESMKCWFDVFFTIPPAAYIGFPFSIFSQLVCCVRYVLTLHRLTICGNTSWDETGVWTTTDPIIILDYVIANFEQVARLAGLDNSDSQDQDVFSRTAQMFHSLRPGGWGARQVPNDESSLEFPQNIDEAILPGAPGLEPFDDNWLTDLFLFPTY